MQRVGFVLLSVGGLVSCGGGDDEPLCAPADEVLVFEDNDEDGFGGKVVGYRCELVRGQSTNNVDCNDYDPLVFPGALEICDNQDNNCNGAVDESFNPQDFWLDADGDGYGDVEERVRTCEDPGVGYVRNADDCDDGRGNVSPGATEQCDNDLDDDCNGIIDDRFETDCLDYKDDDCDQKIDCADEDCDTDPACRLECTDLVLSGGLPLVFNGSTTDPLPNGVVPSDSGAPNIFCTGNYSNGAPDVTLQWRAPETGYFTFSTEGSSFDTVLSIYVNQCNNVKWCNDNDPDSNVSTSKVTGTLYEGDLVAIKIDGVGFGADRGDFKLTITRGN